MDGGVRWMEIEETVGRDGREWLSYVDLGLGGLGME